MTRLYSVFWLLLCACLATAVAASNTSPISKAPEMTFEFNENSIGVHEPLILVFKVHNGLERTISLELGVNSVQFFDFALTSSQGQSIQGHPQDSEGLSTQAGKIIIEPGQDYREELLLNRWFDLDSPGKYVLSARLATVIDEGSFGVEVPQPQRLPLEVKPRNADRLARICAALEREVESGTGSATAQQAAEALSYIDDPVAVPYLSNLLSARTMAYGKAVRGLERIGNDEAIEALISALNENWGDISVLATASLQRMEDRIANPRLKDAVKLAVERSLEQERIKFIKEQISYLGYRSPQLQMDAIQNLARVQDGLLQAEPILQRLANDQDQPVDVRLAAKDALQTLHRPNY